MQTEPLLLLEFFFTNFIILGGTAFVAFFVVSDSLKMSRRKIYLGTFVFTLAYACLSTLFFMFELRGLPAPLQVLFYVHPAFAVVGGAVLYLKFVDADRGKLFFILLLLAHCAFFCFDIARSTYWGPDIEGGGDAQTIALLIAFVVLYPLFAWILRRLWRDIRDMENVKWLRLCLLPLMFIALSFLLRNVFAFELAVWFLRPTVVLVVDICALVTYYMLVSALRRAQETARVEADLRSLNDNLSLQAGRMDELTAHIEEVKILRHDLRHHLLTLAEMLDAHHDAEARAYIAEVRREMPERVAQPLCKNYVADAIVGRCLSVAGQRGIAARAALSIPQEPGISHSDMGIVLGNLMENALEACERQAQGERYIHIEAKMADGRLMIQVENSAQAAVRQGAHFLSSKRPGVGLGLRSVTAIAEKYGGLAQFDSEDGLFRAQVLLFPAAANSAIQTA
ncbi:GHKL domain-containing protein [Ruminococcaceae bacterium OttesenSCG-928-D13]|nr:GHKL domain-containing protein [Ruminococcaceae bacterium OttesenSCG-928-D13]